MSGEPRLGGRGGRGPADTREEKAARWPIRATVLEDKLARRRRAGCTTSA